MLVYVNVTKVANTNTTLPLPPPPQPVAKKLVNATGAENYNILQNNGRIAHQEVDHVSHSVPSPLPALRPPQSTHIAHPVSSAPVPASRTASPFALDRPWPKKDDRQKRCSASRGSLPPYI